VLAIPALTKPTSLALLSVHSGGLILALIAVPAVLRVVSQDDFAVWLIWMAGLQWASVLLDSGLSVAAFRTAASDAPALRALSITHRSLQKARAWVAVPLALAGFGLAFTQHSPLVWPSFVYLLGVALSAAWALPLMARPLRCAGSVLAVQALTALGYLLLPNFAVGVQGILWLAAVSQLALACVFLWCLSLEPKSLVPTPAPSPLALLRAGGPLSVGPIATLPYTSVVPLVAGSLAPQALAQLALVERIVKAYQSFQAPIGQALLSRTYDLHARKPSMHKEWVWTVLKTQLALAAVGAAALYFTGGSLMALWTGQSWPDAAPLFGAFSLALVCTSVSNTLANHVLIPASREVHIALVLCALGFAAALLMPFVAPHGALWVVWLIGSIEALVVLGFVCLAQRQGDRRNR
jgi:O-antigen/teichoic acid export membrane protein